jgi:hypothetical protein
MCPFTPDPTSTDLTHHFMAHNVARQHCRNEIVKQVQV